MVWRDLDIHIVRWPMDKREFFALGARVAELLKPQRMQYRDETVGATPNLPKGLYWGIYLGDERKGAWKIDIWVTDAAGFEATRLYCEALGRRLDTASREAILRIKAKCWQDPEYRRGFSSVDIYSAVLDHGVSDIEGFWAFLRTYNRVF